MGLPRHHQERPRAWAADGPWHLYGSALCEGAFYFSPQRSANELLNGALSSWYGDVVEGPVRRVSSTGARQCSRRLPCSARSCTRPSRLRSRERGYQHGDRGRTKRGLRGFFGGWAGIGIAITPILLNHQGTAG